MPRGGVTLVCHSPTRWPLGQVKGVTVPEFIRFGPPRRLFALFSPFPGGTGWARLNPVNPHPRTRQGQGVLS